MKVKSVEKHLAFHPNDQNRRIVINLNLRDFLIMAIIKTPTDKKAELEKYQEEIAEALINRISEIQIPSNMPTYYYQRHINTHLRNNIGPFLSQNKLKLAALDVHPLNKIY